MAVAMGQTQVGAAMLTGIALEDRIRKARTALLLDAPFLGTLALKLALVDKSGSAGPRGMMGTIATDGTRFYYWGEWLAGLSDAELVGGWAHEVGHCMLMHPYRMGDRDAQRWNVAADYAVNPLLDGQFTLPSGGLLDGKYAGMYAEQIYGLLPPPEDGGDGRGPGGEPGGDDSGEHWGVVLKAPSGAGTGDDNSVSPDGGRPGHDMTELDWSIAIEQAAMVARKAGRMPGALDSIVCGALWGRPADWREKLRRFFMARVPSDYSWRVPSRRAMMSDGAGAGSDGGDMIYPGIAKDGAPRMGGVLDVSGSIGSDAIAACIREVAAIVREVKPSEFTLLLADDSVRKVLRFDPDSFPSDLTAVGVTNYGGGTSFAPGLEWFLADMLDGGPGTLDGGGSGGVACVIYMTADAENYDTAETKAAGDKLAGAGVPILWAVDAHMGGDALSRAPGGVPGGVGEVVLIDTSGAGARAGAAARGL